MDIIRRLQEIAPLSMRLSHDKFHLLELYIKKLVERVDKNNEMFTQILGYNPKDKYFAMDDDNIVRVGKAKTLTQEDLDAINKWIKPTYYHLSFLSTKFLGLKNIINFY